MWSEMILKINRPIRIDNLNRYPSEIVQQLEGLLASGVEARLDPNRRNFYQVDHADRGFFIHAFSAASKVMLLASWPVELSVSAAVL
jgi:hypothetical protein